MKFVFSYKVAFYMKKAKIYKYIFMFTSSNRSYTCTLSHLVRQEYTTTFEHDARLYTCTQVHYSREHAAH